MKQSTSYHSYMLRLWHPSHLASGDFYASLEDPKSHQIRFFKGIDELMTYLKSLPSIEDSQSDQLSPKGKTQL